MNGEFVASLNTLRERPNDPEALQSLEKLLSSAPSLPDEAAGALQQSLQYHREHANWDVVVRLVDLQLPRIADPAQRAELLALKGHVLHEELLDDEGAVAAFDQALELRPDDERTRDLLEHIVQVREKWEAVAGKYVDEAEATTDRQLATSFFLSAAEEVWRHEPGSPKVEQYLRRALQIEPRNRKASGHWERLLRRDGRLKELAELLEQRADVAAGAEERLAALLSAGDLWAHELGDADAAAARYRRALAMDPADPHALRCLVDALTAQENWTALVRLYDDALRARPSAEREEELLLEIAGLLEGKLGQADQAEEYYRRIRKNTPTHPAMLDFYRRYYRQRGEATKILVLLDGASRMEADAGRRLELAKEMARVAEEEVGNLEKAIDIWKGIQRIAPGSGEPGAALRRLYRATTPPKWNALRELLKDEIEGLPDEQAEQKIRLLLETVEIYRDHLKLDVMVINTYNAILALQPDHAEALDALARKYESMGRWNDLIGLLSRRRDAQDDAAGKIETLHRIAQLWIEKFGNQSQAIKPLSEILAIDPTEERALQLLRDIHTRRRNWRELLELCRLEAASREGDRRRAIFKEMASLAAEKLGDAREGIQVWNQMLEEDPRDPEALAELATLYRKEERWAALAEVLHRQANAAGDRADEALPLLEALGDIYTNRLRAVDNAIEAWREVLSLRPEAAKARAVLRELYVQEQRWDDLDELFRARGEYSELAETLSAAADRIQDRQLKVELYCKVGRICWENLKNGDRASKAYERVIAIDPDHGGAAAALVPLYRSGEKWTRLLATYETLLRNAERTPDKLSLLGEVRLLCERQLNSKTLAFQWCAQAFTLDPSSPDLRHELERLACDAEAWEDLVRIYAERAEQLPAGEDKVALLRHVAQLCGERLHRTEEAERYYRQVLELEASDQQALEALEDIYLATQRWADLSDVYRRLSRLTPDVDLKLDLLFKIAFLHEERLGDPEGAIRTLIEIAELDPASLRALRSLERLYLVSSRWEPLVDVLRRELELLERKEERVDVLHRVGEIHRTHLDRAAEAIGFYALALEVDPLHRPTVQALETYLDAEPPAQAQVAKLLQPFYERTESWSSVARTLDLLLAVEDDRDTRIGLYRRLISIHGRRLDDPAAAFAAGSNIMALDPEDAEVRREMWSLAERLNRVDELAGLIADALHRLPAGAEATEKTLSWELAELLDERLGRPEEAERYLRRVVELDPRHQEAFDKLERVLRDAGKWPELRDVLMQRKELAQAPALRRDILLQISVLNEEVLGDAPAAIRAYEEILTLEPGHTESLHQLERHYAAAARFQDLLDLLRREMDFAPDDAGLNDLKLRQAELLAHQLDDPVAAVDLLEETVALDPNLQAAVDLLEELKQTQPGDGERGVLRRRVTEILEPVYQRRENWGDLVRILLVRRALSEDRFEIVELLRRAARIYEEALDDRVAAFGAVREALLLEPGAPEIQASVERLAGELSAWNEAADAWERAFAAADPDDLALRGNLLLREARVLDEKLVDPTRARQAYERLLVLDPGTQAMVRPAAEALVRLYEDARAWPELIGVLRRQLEWTEDGSSRRDVRLRVARIQEEMMGDNDAAVSTYYELLAEQPDAAVALDALERLHLQRQEWSELVGVYRRRVALTASAEARRGHWLRIAGLYESEMSQPEEAIAAYLSLLDELPEDLEALRALAALYRADARYPELLDVLERELRLCDPEARVGLLFEAATLGHQHLNEPGMAIDRYREVLALEPGHAGAREALQSLLADPDLRLAAAAILAPLYENESSWDNLIRVMELQAEAADAAGRVELLGRVADLCETALEDLDRAFDAYRRAVLSAAADSRLLALCSTLGRLAEARSRFPELCDCLEAVLPDVIDSDAQRALHRQAAEVSRGSLHDLSRARRHYQAIVDADVENLEALENLDAILAALGEWEALLGVLSRRVALCTDDEGRRDLLLRSARVWREQESQPDEAIADYEQVLRLFPTDREALTALDELYTATERWPELADLLEREIQAAQDKGEQVVLRYRLGRLRATHLDDPTGALREYQEVLYLDAGHEAVVAELEGYLENPDLRVEAARMLETIYVARQDWVRLIRIYEIRLEAAEDSERRLALITRIAQLYEEQLEDLEGAFVWYGKVALEKPADGEIRDQLLRLAGILDRWPEVAEIFAQYLDHTFDENETTRTVSLLLGNIYDDRLSKVDAAAACFRRALDANRDDEEAFELLEGLLTRYDRWQDLLALYQEAVEATLGTAERRELLLKICRVWEEALDNLPEAIDSYRTVLDLDENDEVAVQALDRLYTETARWQDLCELLLRRADLVPTEEERVAITYRLGTIHELRLENLPSAIDYYEDVLRREPHHGGAIAALERLILDHDQRFRISQILEPLYREQDEWAKLVVIYDAQLDFIDDKERRNFLFREIARLHESRDGSLVLAFRALCRAFQEGPETPDLLEELERLAGKVKAWADLVGVLKETCEGLYDFVLLAGVLTRLAHIEEEQLGDRAAAVEAWSRVLGAQEDNREAVDALIRLHDALGQPEALIEVLTRRAELTADDPAAQKEDYYRIARLHAETLKQPERAIDIYRQVLAFDDNDLTSLQALEQLYVTSSNWMELIWVLRRKLDLAAEPAERRSLLLSVAEVYEEKLEDQFEAIATYKSLLDDFPGDAQVLDALDRLYTREQLHTDLLEVVESKVRIETDPARRNALTFRAGSILEKDIGDLDAAIDHYRSVVEDAPANVDARQALERLVRGPSNREILVEILEALYQRGNEVKPLVEVLELQLEVLSDLAARRDLLLRIGKLHEEGLSDGHAAFAAFARALAEDPAHDATRAELERLADKLGAIKELVAIYRERLDGIYDPLLARHFHLKVAGLLEQRLHEDAEAAEHYRAALETGDELAPLQALDRVLERMGRDDELLEVLGREIAVVAAAGEQAQLFFRMGQIHEKRGDRDGAFGSYREAVEREATHSGARQGLEGLLASEDHRVAALDVLEPLVEGDGDFRKLVDLLEVRLTTLETSSDRTGVLERIAQYHEEKLGAPEQALRALGRALAEDPGSHSVLDALERVAGQLGRFRELCSLADEVLARESNSADGVRELGLRLARWYGEKLNDLQGSERVFKKVLEADPEVIAAFDGLERIYRGGGDNKELGDLLWRRAELEHDGIRRCELLTEVAELRERSLADAAGAIAAWRAVLDTDPSSERALESLATLYQSTKAWTSYLEILERQADAGDGGRQVALKHLMAEVQVRELQDPERGIELYREIVDLEPTDAQAVQALELLYTARQDWHSLQEVLGRKLDAASGRDRIPVLLERAELSRKRLAQPDEAIGYYQQVLAEEGDNQQALAELEAVLAESSKWYDLIEVLERHANVLAAKGDSRGELELLVRIARIWSESLEQPDAAAEMLEKVLQRDPRNVTTLAGLARLYETTQQWERCREVLQQAAALNPEPRAAAELEFRMGKLDLVAGSDEASATSHYARALELDPGHQEARAALEAHCRKVADWASLSRLLEARADAGESEERVAVLRELGGIYLERLQQPEQAVRAMERARELRGDDAELLALLADAYLAAGRVDDSAPILKSLVELASRRRGKEVARYIQRLGAIAEKQGRVAEALEHYDKAYRIDSTHGPTLAALGRIYVETADWQNARKIYRSMLLQNMEPKADILYRLGQAHAALGERTKAINMFERGLEADPKHEGLKQALQKARG